MTQPSCVYIFLIQSVFVFFFLIQFIAQEVGCEETGNWRGGWRKGLLYNQQRVSRVTQRHYNPLHPRWFRSYKQKPEEKTDERSVPSIVLFFVFFSWQTVGLDAERGLSRAHCLIREQQVGSQGAREREKKTHTSPPLLWVILCYTVPWYIYAHIRTTPYMHTHTNQSAVVSAY